MTLKGQLQHFSLGELFQTLALNQHTGCLILKHEDAEKSIYFSNGTISLLSTGRSMRLGEILLRDGQITPEDLEAACEEQKKGGKLLGRILIDHGHITVEELRRAISRQILIASVNQNLNDIQMQVTLLNQVSAEMTSAGVDPDEYAQLNSQLNIIEGHVVELGELSDSDFNLPLMGFDEFEIAEIMNGANFDPGDEDDQGRLDELDPIIIKCPHCGEKFNTRDA